MSPEMEHLDVHFLNVGHGDCTFIDHPSGRLTMIDVNNSKSLPEGDEVALAESKGVSIGEFRKAAGFSWSDYYKALLVDPHGYYEEHFSGREIFRYIQTHPDMDHMTGLCRFFWDEEVVLGNFWDNKTTRTRKKEEFDGSPYDWNDWLMYGRLREGKRKNDKTHTVVSPFRATSGDYWTADGITVLGPTPELVAECNKTASWNDASYVLRLGYAQRSVIFGGDAEAGAWEAIEAHWGAALDCDILKAAHHGRESGYSESATDLMDPYAVICSVGTKPETDASDEYRSHDAAVLSTRFHGSITARIWADGEVWVEAHDGDRIYELPPV